MKIYTRTGDNGTTSLFGGTRVPKHHIRIESYGTVDELNSHLGLIRDQDINAHYKNLLMHIQDRLFTIGAILATDPEKAVLKSGKERLNIEKISLANIERLEQEMDAMNDELPPMTNFVLPGLIKPYRFATLRVVYVAEQNVLQPHYTSMNLLNPMP